MPCKQCSAVCTSWNALALAWVALVSMLTGWPPSPRCSRIWAADPFAGGLLRPQSATHTSSYAHVFVRRTIYNMCTQKPPHDYSEQLYSKYREAFNQYITEKVRRRGLRIAKRGRARRAAGYRLCAHGDIMHIMRHTKHGAHIHPYGTHDGICQTWSKSCCNAGCEPGFM